VFPGGGAAASAGSGPSRRSLATARRSQQDGPVTVLFASAPHADTFGYSMPPPGLLRLGGELLRAGHDVRLEDLAHALARGEVDPGDELAASCARRLLSHGPSVVGLSVMGATVPIALAIAAELRRLAPQVPIWFGGPGTTGVDRPLLERFPAVELIVRGEGERTVLELLRARAAGREPRGIPGVTWRDCRGQVHREADRAPLADLAELPPYAYALLPSIAQYKEVTGAADGLVPIDSGRGCVYDCSFCTIGRFWGRRSRTLPVERLVDEIAALATMPGARSAYLCHDLFGADRDHTLRFARRMVERGVQVPFEIRARLDHLDDECIDALARAGCYRVLLGVESASGTLRNRHGKRMAVDLAVVERIGRLGDAGLVPILSLIVGLPGEEPADLAATCELALACALRTAVQLSFHLVNPQPGCGLGEDQGPRSRPVEGLPPDMALGSGTTAAERALIAAHPDLFSTFALLTDLPGGEDHLRRLHRLASLLPERLQRTPKSVALLARRRKLSVLELFEVWMASGRSFEALVAAERDPLLDDLLAWEQATQRAAAAGLLQSNGPQSNGPQPPRSRAQLVRSDFDLPAVAAALRSGADLVSLPRRATHLAVIGDRRGTRSLRLGADVPRLLGELDGRSAEQLERSLPGIGAALQPLAEHGLVDLGADGPEPAALVPALPPAPRRHESPTHPEGPR
jgi:radical SAM superfamily enzyme YgiQ (UPF0313 family)